MVSEGCLAGKTEGCLQNRVGKCNLFGMEAEAAALLPIKAVAYNGTMKSGGMGGVNAQLVGTSCLGIERDAGFFPVVCNDLVAGDGLLPETGMNHLKGTVHRIGAEG